jgi:glycosyltransferase involved in cell wall biosynthesis
MKRIWHIVTGEYPPQHGGVSDYSRLVACGLANKGDDVCVWAPACDGESPADAGVEVHRLPDQFGLRGLIALSAGLSQFQGPRRILVQYVPHAFGWKALNFPLCLWLLARRRDSIRLMFHEVYFPLEKGQKVAHKVLAYGTRWMALIAAHSAERVYVSIPSWKYLLEELTSTASPITWLPVPSNIDVVNEPQASAAIRTQYTLSGEYLIGHFGTYGLHIGNLLVSLLPKVLHGVPNAKIVLLGAGGNRIIKYLDSRHPDLSDRVIATGALDSKNLSHHLTACDLMIQPYVDGVSTRRGSVMAALAHGLPIVTTAGPLTEALWSESRAVRLEAVGDSEAFAASTHELLIDENERHRLSAASVALYLRCFDVQHTIAALRQSTC